MKIIPNYGSEAFIVPSEVLKHLSEADETALRCLLYSLSHIDFNVSSAAEQLGVPEEDFIESIRFWEESGVISLKSSKRKQSTATKSTKKEEPAPSVTHKRTSSLPVYTTAETAKFLEDNAQTAKLIDACESILGKIFTTAETNIVIGLIDHLGLSAEYIMLLFAHAGKTEKRSVRYVEKLALSLVDRDITKYEELEAELASLEKTENAIVKIRSLFGMGTRAVTPQEKKMISNWCVKWKFSDEIIEKAYEITANTTGGASLKYANAILENWHNEGLKSLEEIESYSVEYDKSKRGASKYTKKGSNATPLESSFDTDDFFEAALRRSYEETSGGNG